MISSQGKLQINITILDRNGTPPNVSYELMEKLCDLLKINAGSNQTITLNGIYQPNKVSFTIKFAVSYNQPIDEFEYQSGRKILTFMLVKFLFIIW